MAATTTSPVKILLDLGYEIWEMEKDGYRSALMESINDLTRINPRDGRIAILIQALKNLKRAPDKPKINISKVLNKRITGADIKPVDIEKKEGDAPALMPDRLDNIANTVDSIALLLRRQFGVEKKQRRDDRKKQDKDNKDARENKLEKKPDKKTGLIPKAIAKPTLSFFDKIKRFFLNIAIGSAVYKMLDWLKDPANAEKISKFSEFLINNAGWILGGLAAIALLPVLSGIMGVLGALKGGLLLLKPALGLLFSPAGLAALALAAGLTGTLLMMKSAVDAIKEKAAGGSAFLDKFEQLKSPLEKAGIQIVGSGENEKFYIAGSGRGQGGQSGRKTVEKHGTEKQKKLVEEYIKKRDNIIGIRDEMRSDMKLKESEIRKDSSGGRVGSKKIVGKIQTEKEKIREEYERKLSGISTSQSTDSSALKSLQSFSSNKATIDKNLKKETNISPPNTKGKGSTTIIDGGGGQQQSVGGGGGGINGTTPPSFPSQDPNNLGTFSTQGMYNMVG
ncbi:MAG: hypothetical protein CBD63_02930 [Candidatus Pelagibacter sp. TMED203]|nr:MAG: hypothetical protein CBD63_02930 [Candidatus Pelagibacter sp. TMED203]